MKNVGDLAENEATLVHAASLNKKTDDVSPVQMRHIQKSPPASYLSRSQSLL